MGFPHCWIRPYATSASSRPLRSRAGEVAGCRRKRNGNALRTKRRSTETCLTQADCILKRRAAPAWSSSSEIVGNGLRAPTPATRDTSHFPVLLGSTTQSSCVARWFCAVGPASQLQVMCVRPTAISFSRRRGGSSQEYVWQPKRNSLRMLIGPPASDHDSAASDTRTGARGRVARGLHSPRR